MTENVDTLTTARQRLVDKRAKLAELRSQRAEDQRSAENAKTQELIAREERSLDAEISYEEKARDVLVAASSKQSETATPPDNAAAPVEQQQAPQQAPQQPAPEPAPVEQQQAPQQPASEPAPESAPTQQ